MRAAAFAAAGALLSTVVAGGSATAAISTDGDDVVIETMQADVGIGRGQNGVSALTVAETFVARFPASGESRGMRRDVADSSGDTARLPRLISVTDGDGAERPSEVETSDGGFSMTSLAPEGLRGTQTFVFTYTVDGVVTVGDGSQAQELTWAVTGRERSSAIGEVRATFRVPEELVPSLEGQPRCLIAPEGSTKDCDLAITPGQLGAVLIEASATDLAADETMSLVVGFAPDTFTAVEDGSGATVGWVLALTGAAALGVGAGIVVMGRRRRSGASRKGPPRQS
ncbi:hypothetical protein HDC37_001727 [Microbacterium sp. AK009]|uniref:DUF2207 domain-containing protein n=1 Tax=Microbacterium sp. AK009 TaxID=2723068 RepID=UPI0015CE8ACF|nr:DUF2207 domain-containing protein [Microbacterium sp. AK009]NYF16902.1 hypothetical protein [Microbacterium sp. AK009]